MTRNLIAGSGGGKGGGDSRAPVEAPDDLISISKARILDLVSEGEIVGLVDGLNSIYLDETPLATAGQPNFQGLNVQWRNGTQDQAPIAGFPSVENTTPIGVELKADTPFVRDFTDLDVDTVRISIAVPQLFKVSTDNGDTNGYSVQYAIDVSVDGGPFAEVLARSFTGKTTSKYVRSHDIVLPPATENRTIRVRRLTPNANSGTNPDVTTIDSVTEIISQSFVYPNSALIGVEVSAEQFQSIPRRAYHIRGLIVRVPTNYDPETRTYSGVWDGTFKRAWTNNPAWILRDLITNNRYGLGDRIPSGWMDSAALYQIARYCDQMVPSGYGDELEPRFTCNTQIQDRSQAFELVQNLASIFQGMCFYASGIVTPVADQPKDPSAIYTNSDVLGGRFTYAGAPKSTRYTVALVGWNNPQNFFKTEIEAVEDTSGMLRYGYNETQFTAFACTSRGQAHRAGKWALITSQLETETMTFTVGLKGLRSRPGDIIQIADESFIGAIKGGLISAATINTVTADCDFDTEVGETLKVMLPSGVAEERTIQSISGRVIQVNSNFSEVPQVQGTWVIDGAIRLQEYRVMSIAEKEGGTQYELKCLEYRADKYDAIANGTKLDARPVTAIPPSVQPPPTNVRLSQHIVVNQGIAQTTATIAWDAAPKAIAYEGAWRKDEGEWIPIYRTGSLNVEIPNIYAGRYVAQIRAINALDIRSTAAFSSETALSGKTTPPPVVTSLVAAPLLWGISLKWTIPAQGAEDVQRTEIWYSATPAFEDATKLSDLAYPQNSFEYMGLSAGTDLYFWVRLVDRSGNFGEFFPAGAGVLGSSSSEAGAYLDAIRDEVLTTDLASQLIGEQIDETLELTRLMDEAERYIREDEDAQVSRKVEELSQSVDDRISASVTGLQEVITAGDSALAQRIDTVEAQVGDDLGATIESMQTAIANTEQALASDISTVTARIEDSEASIEANATAIADTDGKLSAAYTLKTVVTEDGKRYAAGIGLGVENDPDGPGFISQILLQADRLALLNVSNSGVTTPFAVQGGQVFINNALIQTGAITTAKIADAQITAAKIANAQITAAKIADANITTAKIADAQITTAKIGTAQVDRLRIAGNSATTAASVYYPRTYVYFDGPWVTSCVFYITAYESVDLLVNSVSGASLIDYGSGGVQPMFARILCDGVEIGTSSYSAEGVANEGGGPRSSTATIGIAYGLSVGTHTIEIQRSGADATGMYGYADARAFAIVRYR